MSKDLLDNKRKYYTCYVHNEFSWYCSTCCLHKEWAVFCHCCSWSVAAREAFTLFTGVLFFTGCCIRTFNHICFNAAVVYQPRDLAGEMYFFPHRSTHILTAWTEIWKITIISYNKATEQQQQQNVTLWHIETYVCVLGSHVINIVFH